jgi:hypothetical protein
MKRKWVLKMFGALLVIGVSAGVSWGQFGFQVVKDPWKLAQDSEYYGKQLGWLENILDVAEEHRKFVFWNHEWTNDPLIKAANTRARLATLGRRIRDLGGRTGEFDEKLGAVAEALDRLQDVIEGKSAPDGDIRSTVYTLFGETPVNEFAGSRYEFAVNQAVSAMAFTSDTNKAIEDHLKDYQYIDSIIDGAGASMTEEDRQRYQMLQKQKQMELEALGVQSMNQNNRLLASALLRDASQDAALTRYANENRRFNVETLGALRFWPGGRADKPGSVHSE